MAQLVEIFLIVSGVCIYEATDHQGLEVAVEPSAQGVTEPL